MKTTAKSTMNGITLKMTVAEVEEFSIACQTRETFRLNGNEFCIKKQFAVIKVITCVDTNYHFAFVELIAGLKV